MAAGLFLAFDEKITGRWSKKKRNAGRILAYAASYSCEYFIFRGISLDFLQDSM